MPVSSVASLSKASRNLGEDVPAALSSIARACAFLSPWPPRVLSLSHASQSASRASRRASGRGSRNFRCGYGGPESPVTSTLRGTQETIEFSVTCTKVRFDQDTLELQRHQSFYATFFGKHIGNSVTSEDVLNFIAKLFAPLLGVSIAKYEM